MILTVLIIKLAFLGLVTLIMMDAIHKFNIWIHKKEYKRSINKHYLEVDAELLAEITTDLILVPGDKGSEIPLFSLVKTGEFELVIEE